MAPYSRNFAKPCSACRFVIAAVRVVWDGQLEHDALENED